ncbi:MAG TPA: hypothetical protein VGN72_22220 [Tepidisphaeraceae bacterium]|jgi:hypothetical protein|nr:hypothetical protein [Tepidisphaeraceae bacterium]
MPIRFLSCCLPAALFAVLFSPASLPGQPATRPAADASVLASQDFEGPFAPVQGSETAKLTGSFPADTKSLRIDSNWATIAADFAAAAGTGGQEETALAIEVREVTEGAVMLLVPGPIPLDGASEINVSFLLRGGGQPVVVNLRETHAPNRKWNVIAGRTVTSTNEWQRAEVRFPPANNEHGGQIELRFARAGDYLIDDLRVTAVRRDAEAERAALAGRNLLDASSQPAGATAAWSVPPQVRADPGQTGPTGVAAMRFDVDGPTHGQNTSVYLSVPTEVGGPYTLSFWARKDGPGQSSVQARLYPDDAQPWWAPQYSKSYELGDEWRRITHTATLPSAAEGFHVAELVVKGAGPDVLVDGLMVEVGTSASDFVRAAPVELGLTDAVPLGVHYEDEPIEFGVHAWGKLSTLDHVRLTLTDGLGQMTEVRADPKSDADGTGGTAKATVTVDAATMAFGPLLVQARAFDASGQPISPFEELVAHKIRRPWAAGRFLADSPFGVHVWHDSTEQIDAAARLGFRWARLFDVLEWPTVEPKQGTFDWSKPDDLVEELEGHGFGMMAILGLTPEWARKAGDFASIDGYWVKKVVPADVEQYARYVGKVVERYKGRIDVYEPWNEPFWARFFVTDFRDGAKVRGTPAEYAALHKAAADAVRAADPDALVGWNIGGAYDTEDARENDRRIAALGVLEPKYTDVLTVHDYGGVTAPAGFPGDVASTKHPKAAVALAEEFGRPGLPVWDGESGMPPAHAKGSWYEHAAPFGRRVAALDQADQLVRVYVSRLAAGEAKWFLYTFSARTAYRPTYDMLAADGHLPPFGSTLSNLFWHLEGLGFAGHFSPTDGVEAYHFEGRRPGEKEGGSEGEAASVVVLLPRSGEITLNAVPADVAVRDWYGNDLAVGARLSGRPAFVSLPAGVDAQARVAALLRAAD